MLKILTVLLSLVTGLMNSPAIKLHYDYKQRSAMEYHLRLRLHTTNCHVRIKVMQFPTLVCCISKKLDELCSVSLLVSLHAKQRSKLLGTVFQRPSVSRDHQTT